MGTNILIVDDDNAVRRLFRSLLSSKYTICEAASGKQAISIARECPPDLVLLDIMMPGLNGHETCLQLKALPVQQPPQIIMVSARSESLEQAKAFEAGADDYLVKPVDPVELRSRVDLHFRLRKSQAATAELQREIDGHHEALRQSAEKRVEKVLAVQDVAMLALAKVAESRDNETGEHIARMRDYAYRLAQELQRAGPYTDQIDSDFLSDLYRSAPLHDVGKVGIPDSVLLKLGRLTQNEFQVMKRHAVIGANILNDVVERSDDAGFLSMAAEIAQFHHERWDGTGYPAGLQQEQIPLSARIAAVADVYDALTSYRPYKQAWSAEEAKEAIADGSGTQFDPACVDAFLNCFDDIIEIQLKHGGQEPIAASSMSFLEYDLLETA